jgi:hypothetical protein
MIVVHLSDETTALLETVARTTEADNIVCMFSYQMAETISHHNQSNM